MTDIGFGIARAQPLMAARFSELCKYASKVCGISLVPVQVPTYVDLVSAMQTGEVAVAWMPPVTAVDVSDQKIADVLALPLRSGSLTYHTALIARRSELKPVESYRGMRVAWVDVQSASGYLIPRIHLGSLGFDARTFFREEIFERSHLGVVDAVASHKADIGGTYCSIDPVSGRVVRASWTSADGKPIRPVDIVTSVGPLPNDAIMGTAALDGLARAAIVRFLLAPDDPAKLLLSDVFNTSDYRVMKTDHFSTLRHTIRQARARGHGSLIPRALADAH